MTSSLLLSPPSCPPPSPAALCSVPPYNLQFAQISAGPTKFRWPRSKIKGTILAIGHWPEMAKIRDEPRKIIPTSETENILQDKYLLYFYKLWVFIYFKWLSDRPQSASFWVKATFLFYSTDKIPWNHHSPLISITGLKMGKWALLFWKRDLYKPWMFIYLKW